jgi:hypothetical protein
MTIEIDQSQFTRVCSPNEKTFRYAADPAREAALKAVRPRPNRQKYRQGVLRTRRPHCRAAGTHTRKISDSIARSARRNSGQVRLVGQRARQHPGMKARASRWRRASHAKSCSGERPKEKPHPRVSRGASVDNRGYYPWRRDHIADAGLIYERFQKFFDYQGIWPTTGERFLLALFLALSPAAAQSPFEGYSFRNITTDTTTVVKDRPGFPQYCLHQYTGR